MEKMKVKVFIPALCALKAHSTVFGESVYEPQDIELKLLSDVEAQYLAAVLENGIQLRINAASPSWEAIRVALRVEAGVQ